jgi:2-polyprenyl-3-methyl-5-hydroxy-6-metoxy-1,4-benzoquinol methylase
VLLVRLHSIVSGRLQLDPALPVVDVGCGNGHLSRLLAGAFPPDTADQGM